MLLLLSASTLFAQNYPSDPTLSKITADMKADPVTKQTLEAYGYDPSVLDKGKMRFAKKSELKDHFYEKWYWRSDYAYKISLNRNYCDMRSFALFLDTPKDAQGVSHKIFFKVTYNRRTPQDFEDKKWNYEYNSIAPIECEAYGLPKLTNEQRKKMMMDYIMNEKDNDEAFNRNHPIHTLIEIDSIMAYDHSYEFYQPKSAFTFHWTLTVLGDYTVDRNSEGGTEKISTEYLNIPFTATYKNGSYELKALYKSWPSDYRNTDTPGFKKLYDNGTLTSERLSDPIWFYTLYDKGFEAIMGKRYTKEQPAGSEAFIKKRLAEIEEALKVLATGSDAEIETTLQPYVDPNNSAAIIQSFQQLIAMYRKKVCTLEMNNLRSEIPYSYELGDTEGPWVNLYMSVKRESARTKELKKKYKAAGMSGSVLKSTSRGSEYGKLSNKSYEQKFVLKLINNNWYICDSAELEQAEKIRF